jgi:DNA-binding SARP family transcriptional activator/Flp pilus assembly protein TadD
MARLAVRLLGPLRITIDSVPVTSIEREKSRALLAYLAFESERPHRREQLAEMLWPDRPEGTARGNLRHVISDLRGALGDRTGSEFPSNETPFLLVTRDTIQFNCSADYWVDTTAYLQLIEGNASTPQPRIRQLEEAVQLYRGTFLEDISVTDSVIFHEWILFKREQFSFHELQALSRLTRCYQICGEYDLALKHAWRQVELAPWDEGAHQQVMRLLTLNGQQGAALAHYETCQKLLAVELGVDPGAETVQLFEKISLGELEAPTIPPLLTQRTRQFFQPPSFLEQGAEEREPSVFVTRERELARLNSILREMLSGCSRVAFITGEAGRGKTALLNEFTRLAISENPDLLVASGNCNAHSGSGDPYLPFRDVMAMLTGNVETRWVAGAISREQARRLWEAQSLTVQAVLTSGSSLIGTFLTGEDLIVRAATAVPDQIDWLEQLSALIELRWAGELDLEQRHLFEQFTNVLRSLAHQHPLVLILDDLQWADNGSVDLLFHLGRRLTESRVLIVCAYRPEEVGLDHAAVHHPLVKVLREFKRIYGDVWVDLGLTEAAERRRFVDDFLDTEPNRLTEQFRNTLYHRTGGHPLFTVELLRAMRERGDLLWDEKGYLTQGLNLDWEMLPARVEAVIEERIGRLDPAMKEILTIASVEGEVFTAQVLAEVQPMEERSILGLLSQELEKRYNLVLEHGEIQTEQGRISRYRFSHILFQDYLYGRLSLGESQLLHGQVAAALEKLHEGQLDEVAVQLAHHYFQANDYQSAFKYFTWAAENAIRIYANNEAIKHYTKALELAGKLQLDVASLADLQRGRGLAYEALGEFEHARDDHEKVLQVARTGGDCQLEWRANLDLGKLWASRDYRKSLDYYERALNVARGIDDQKALVESLNWMGNWYANAEDSIRATAYHQEALIFSKEIGDRRILANTLDLLGIASLLGCDTIASVAYFDRAIALFREMDDRPSLVSSLTGRGNIGGAAYSSLTAVPALNPNEAERDFDEAIQIARQIGSPTNEAWALWSLGLLYIVEGDFGAAFEAVQSGLSLASEIEHREWIVGNQSTLGVLYLELFSPEEAQRELNQALTLAKELQSQHWIHLTTGTLAAAYHLLGDFTQAQECLKTVISPQTYMDTLHKRYCWARRAELALSQGDSEFALEITDRLINSAPGMSPGSVITFLWKLKAEALAAIGNMDEAGNLLRVARRNAQEKGEQFLLWRIHASLGRLYDAIGHHEDAQEEFMTARQLIVELAATIPDEVLKQKFLEGANKSFYLSCGDQFIV